jgi:flagellar motor switch protein FliG
MPGTDLEVQRTPGALATMGGRQKAAIALVSLGPERAAAVLGQMPQAEVEALSAEMASIWSVDTDTSLGVYEELAAGIESGQETHTGGLDYAREVLTALLGPARADEILSSLTAKGEFRPFEFLRRTPPEQIRTFLADEAPQTIALVLASLYSGLSGRVLAELPAELQTEVAARIATMGETNPEVIADVDAGLRQKLSAISTKEFASPGGVDSLAEILNSAGRSAERTVIEGLAAQDPVLADQVRLRMFTFEDLVELEDREIQLILREVDQKDLVLALRGVGEELTDKILRNLSQRGAEMLREDMEVSPPQRRAVVEEAQGKVVAIVRRLEEDGTIILRSDGGDAEDELL